MRRIVLGTIKIVSERLCPRAKQRCVTSFICYLFLADECDSSLWQHPNFAAPEAWAFTPPRWSIPAGVFFTESQEGRGRRWKFATERQISNSGGLCCQVAHAPQRGRARWPLTWPLLKGNRWSEKKQWANLVGRKDGNEGRGDCGGMAWNKVFRNRSTSISFFLLSL